MTVTFGDLMLAGAEHLDTAFASWKQETTAETAAAVIRSIHSATGVLCHFAADIAAAAPRHSAVRPTVPLWWQAAAGAQSGLILASAALEEGIGQLGLLGSRISGVAASHISQAAGLLAAARDLMQTNRITEPGHGLVSLDWSSVMNSPEVAGALLSEVAEWSQWFATWLSQTQVANPALPPNSRRMCAHACRGLWTVVATAEMAGKQHPVSPTARKLLYGIPSAVPPARRSPDGQEPVDELCEQARISAQRVRAVAHRAAVQAHWSPGTTADSWQWTAEAGVIISHMSSLLLGSIGTHEEVARTFPLSGPRIRAASYAVTRACDGWRQAAAAWDTVTTETQGLTSPVIADVSDLLLRIGRITFDNPQWTPARAQQAPPRQPDELAGTSARLQAVITAAHEAIDALACVASADRQAVDLADRAWRLHVPTRCLPEDYDVPHPMGPATLEQVNEVLAAYDTAASVSVNASMMLEDLVLCIDAPSAPLASARQLDRLADATPAPGPRYDDAVVLRRAVNRPDRQVRPGPVETRLINLGVADAPTLLQAAAIDHAGRSLIADAKQTRHHPNRSHRTDRREASHEQSPQNEMRHYPSQPARGLSVRYQPR